MKLITDLIKGIIKLLVILIGTGGLIMIGVVVVAMIWDKLQNDDDDFDFDDEDFDDDDDDEEKDDSQKED